MDDLKHKCPGCHEYRDLTKRGMMRAHDLSTRSGWVRCRGSGKRPVSEPDRDDGLLSAREILAMRQPMAWIEVARLQARLAELESELLCDDDEADRQSAAKHAAAEQIYESVSSRAVVISVRRELRNRTKG